MFSPEPRKFYEKHSKRGLRACKTAENFFIIRSRARVSLIFFRDCKIYCRSLKLIKINFISFENVSYGNFDLYTQGD